MECSLVCFQASDWTSRIEEKLCQIGFKVHVMITSTVFVYSLWWLEGGEEGQNKSSNLAGLLLLHTDSKTSS